MALVGHNHVSDFGDRASFVWQTVDIVDQDWLGQLPSGDLGPFDKTLIDEVTSCTTVYKRIGINFFQGVCGSEVYWNADRVWSFFEGADDKFGGEPPFPFGSA